MRKIVQIVKDKFVAWHAGVSFWKNHKNLNDKSIGIEITNPGHSFGYKKFPKQQILSLIKLTKFLITKYKIVNIIRVVEYLLTKVNKKSIL